LIFTGVLCLLGLMTEEKASEEKSTEQVTASVKTETVQTVAVPSSNERPVLIPEAEHEKVEVLA